FQVRDRADEARAALGRAAALIAPGAAGRPLLDFRRGLIAENLTRSPQAARAAYRRAHAGATAHADPLLLSGTWRHLAGLALREGELVEARQGFAESLRIREELGYLVGTAPALVSLADTETEAEASRLREEARRLFRLLGGVPTWLARQSAPPSGGAAPAWGGRRPAGGEGDGLAGAWAEGGRAVAAGRARRRGARGAAGRDGRGRSRVRPGGARKPAGCSDCRAASPP